MSDEINIPYPILDACDHLDKLGAHCMELNEQMGRLETSMRLIRESVQLMAREYLLTKLGLQVTQRLAISVELRGFVDKIWPIRYGVPCPLYEYTIERAEIHYHDFVTDKKHPIGVRCKVVRVNPRPDYDTWTYFTPRIPLLLAVELRQRWLAENEAVE